MTKLKIRDYEPQDFLDIECMEHEMQFRKGMPLAEWALFKKYAGPCYTVVDPQGRIVFCCGIHNMWQGVGEIWAVFSVLAKKYAYTWIAAKKLLSGVMQWYIRLQAVLNVDYPQAIRFGERLGFKSEGLMCRYGPHGEDFFMYALVKEN